MLALGVLAPHGAAAAGYANLILTIDRPQGQGGPITKTQSIDVINPGESKTLTFGNLGQVPFASQVTVTVDVASVPGETNVANNSATYQVIFSLP